jgi:hypothetical protein
VLMLSKFSMSVRTLPAVEYLYVYPGYPHRSTIRASSSVKSLADCAKSVESSGVSPSGALTSVSDDWLRRLGIYL